MLWRFRIGFIRVFNLNGERRPYSAIQLLSMSGIIMLISLVIYYVFNSLGADLAYVIEYAVGQGETGFKVIYYPLFAMTMVSGFIAALYTCRQIWPRRKPIMIKQPPERVIPVVLNEADESVEQVGEEE